MTDRSHMTLDELLAREEIVHLQAVYNTSGDRGRLEELSETFCPDGVLDTGRGRFVGRAAIVDGLREGTQRRATRPSYIRHHLTTRRLEFDSPDRARGWTYFVVFSDHGPDHCGTYIDQYLRTAEGWLIADRRVKIHWDSPDSVLHAPPSRTA